jgi:hypothetical protein
VTSFYALIRFYLTTCCKKIKVSGVGIRTLAINKFQKTNHKYQMVRQAHHLTTLSQPVESLKVERVEGQITMTEIQKSKPIGV